MPTYVYACQACRQVIERRQSFFDQPLTVCEACGGELRRVIQAVPIIFNRSGRAAESRDGTEAGLASGQEAGSADGQAAEGASGPAGSAETKPSSGDAAATDAPQEEPRPPEEPGDGKWHRPPQRGPRWHAFIK